MKIKTKELVDGIVEACTTYYRQCPSHFGLENIDGGCRDEKGVFRCEECVEKACGKLLEDLTR